ncbi:alpha-1,3-mannosyltransferase ALG2 [Crepidotus variabilis]|uniref:Alpha-1,3/1,6-mannosyltransferase ALG2 n=1 Tax=Crepidotus variabilis TaxID=179855 RepID=A0A9P6ER71_9AGAR|nr:alpha-1,3-mannosyltransferase ALG2 [Crepidotus variabilis]
MSTGSSSSTKPLRVAFIHPDLGIGGAERLVVDAALGLQQRGHSVELYTSHHDPTHCFEETKDGTLDIRFIRPPFPRSLKGKFHIVFAHLRQLHLTAHLLLSSASSEYDVFFVDQLSTCIPFLRFFGHTRVVFYCHFPDKLLANGAFVEGEIVKKKTGLLKRLYRVPMDWLEEVTTRQADVILANSLFTSRVFKSYFPSISKLPKVVYPGINLAAYDRKHATSGPEVTSVSSSQRQILSLNRFEGKKNIMLALEAFALLLKKRQDLNDLRLVLAGGYDERLEDNVTTLSLLVEKTKTLNLAFNIISPVSLPNAAVSLLPWKSHKNSKILFLLNFTTSQRTHLLHSPSTLALLYTPENEHFGIVPVEAMACGLPVLACNSGGPLESVLSSPPHSERVRTGWLVKPDAEKWATALSGILTLQATAKERDALAVRSKIRARELFGMEAMAKGLELALREAVDMDAVNYHQMKGFGAVPVVFMVIIGLFVAYIVGP